MPLIVVAEDEFLIADVLVMMLEDAGYEVATAAHGKAALVLVKEKRPALVITDFMMPLMTGLELAQAIRADITLSATPIILTAGRTLRCSTQCWISPMTSASCWMLSLVL